MISGFGLDNDNDDGIDQLTSFEILTPFEKFKRYVESHNVFERQAAGRGVCEAVESCDTREEFRSTMHYVSRLSEDPEPTVRVELMEKVPELSQRCIEKSDQLQLSSSLVEEEILPLVMNFLEDITNTARKAAQTSLVEILPLFQPEVCEAKILPIMLGLAGAHTDDYRTEAVTLLAKIVPRLGREVTSELVLPVYLNSCTDDLFHVRKVCATHAPDFAKVVGLEVTETQILPAFAVLAEDVVWGVRKACADSFSLLSENVSESTRQTRMSELFVLLLNDESRWVRLSAYQELGKFIASFTHHKEQEDEDENHNEDAHVKEVKPKNIQSQNQNVEVVTPVEEPEFSAAKYWKDDLPELDFDSLSLDDDEELELQCDQNAQCDQTDHTEEGEQDNSHEKEEDLQASGDSEELEKKVKKESEASTPDKAIYEALGLNKDEIYMGDEPDDEVPVDYSNQEEEHSSTKNDVYSTENLENDETEIELTPKTGTKENVIGLSDDDDDENNDDPEHLSHSSFLSARSDRSDDGQEPQAELIPQNVIPEILLKYYLSMTMTKSQTEFHESELARHCAYSLPGVALTLGRKNWKCLKAIYGSLAQNVQWKVRRTLAFSIHEIAHILGEKMASEELVDIFNDFLNDLDEVRIGLLKNISAFLSMVNSEARINYLNKMVEFLTTDNIRNWRFRLTLAFQMNKVISLYTPEQVASHHTSIVMDLLTDKIASVRLQAAHLAASITEHLIKGKPQNTEIANEFVENIINFSRVDQKGSKWVNRCIFCYYCNALIDPLSLQHPADEETDLYDLNGEEEFNSSRRREPYVSDEYFHETLLPHLLLLTEDNISNVKICAARTIRNILVSRPFYQDKQSEAYALLETTMKRLKDDSDRDVQQIAEEWLFDEEDDPDFIPLCPEEIEANLPNGQMSFRASSSPVELEDIEDKSEEVD